MKKILSLSLLLVLMCGCEIKADITINTKNEISESVNVEKAKYVMTSESNSYSDYQKAKIKEYSDFGKYQITSDIVSNSLVWNAKTNYQTAFDFRDSFEFKQLFSNAIVEEENNTFSFKTDGIVKYGTLFESIVEKNDLERIIVNIKCYKQIIEYDKYASYDQDNNTLSYIFDTNNLEKQISFKTSNEKRYDVIIKDFFKKNKTTIIVLGSIALVALISWLVITIKIKSHNNI